MRSQHVRHMSMTVCALMRVVPCACEEGFRTGQDVLACPPQAAEQKTGPSGRPAHPLPPTYPLSISARPTGEDDLKRLDSSVKRNSALVKKLRQLTEEGCAGVLKDVANTNQSKVRVWWASH